MNIGKALTTALTTLSVLYFLLGGIFVWQEIITVEAYALIGGIVGSVASSVGLVSLSRPSLQQSNLEKIDSQSLKKIADNTEEIKKLEEERARELHRLEETKVVTAEQIEQFKEQQEQMRLSVRKASLSLFLQEQRRQLKENVLSLVENQETLKESMLKLISVEEKLVALDEEIETDKNVDLLKSIIKESQKKETESRPSKFEEIVSELSPLPRSTTIILNEIFRAYKKIIRSILSIS